MSRSSLFASALLLTVSQLAAAPVPVGPKLPDEPVPVSAAGLLRYRPVQKDLKMTAEQRINLIDAIQDVEEDFEKKFAALDRMQNVPDDAFDKLDDARIKAVTKALRAAADTGLTAEQRTKLRQIDWRVRGPAAFADSYLQKRLELTDDQKKAAAALAERAEAQVESYLDALGNGAEEDKVKAEILTARKDGLKKFVDAMTAEQKERWKGLAGEPTKGLDADEVWFKMTEDEDLDAGK